MYMIFDTVLSLLFVYSGILLELDVFESTETIILAIAGIFSLLLLALSISAYIKTRLNKILYAAVAFALFGIQLIIASLEENIEFFDTQFMSIITSAMTLGILVLFFLAIVKKSN